MLSIEEIVQADIDERNLVRQERVETAEDEADIKGGREIESSSWAIFEHVFYAGA